MIEIAKIEIVSRAENALRTELCTILNIEGFFSKEGQEVAKELNRLASLAWELPNDEQEDTTAALCTLRDLVISCQAVVDLLGQKESQTPDIQELMADGLEPIDYLGLNG